MKQSLNDRQKASLRFIACLILLGAAYIPMFRWMVERWMHPESYYGHGFLIPVVSLYVLWQRRNQLKEAPISSEAAGIIIVAAGLFIHVIAALLRIYFVSGFSFVIVLYGLVLFFFGRKMMRYLIFPIFFLLAMIPLPLVLIGNLTVKLKLFAAQCSTVILNKIGFPSVRDGSIIKMPHSYIAVEAPCSGLRSLIALLTLGLLFAFSAKVSYLRKGIILLSAIPIAMVSNIGRILMLAIVNDLYGQKVAMGFFHDFTGFFVFAFAFTGLWIVGRMIESHKEGAHG